MGYRRPSHRNPRDVQSEVCELCGKLIGHVHLIEADCEGLRGRIVCGDHPMLAWSFLDYRAHNGLMPTPDTSRREPIGASFWFEDTLEVLAADAETYFAIDGLGALMTVESNG